MICSLLTVLKLVQITCSSPGFDIFPGGISAVPAAANSVHEYA
jgi:hypothetical protein